MQTPKSKEENSQEENYSDKIFDLMSKKLPRDMNSIQASIVQHVAHTFGRTRFTITDDYLFLGTAYSLRSRLLEQWNDTQAFFRVSNPRKVYYLSIEFLLGRLFQNALINMDLEKTYTDALMDLGIKIEDIYEREADAGLGNGGLGRLAACYIDSMATLNLPGWGYGLRYDYGIFKQVITNFEQKELPDYWLSKGNPWEVPNLDLEFKIRFYGNVTDGYRAGKKVRVWDGGETVIAVAYDTAVPGFDTYNCNTLRLWRSFPREEFDFDQFNKGEHAKALEKKLQSSFITSVLYPNDSTLQGKELRLKQEYFFSSATIRNVLHRYKRFKKPWSEFPKYNIFQLNDTHPTLAIIEFLRILIDEEELEFKEAFSIVRETFNYTNHTVLPEALEKWSVTILEIILPRHLELMYVVNYFFLEEVQKAFPGDSHRLGRMSIVEDSVPKQIRMANLCVVSSEHINGVAEIHSGLLKTHLFKDFYEMWPNKFTNVTNGVTPRRWVHAAFPELSALLTEQMGSKSWLRNLDSLKQIPTKLEKEGKFKDFMEKYRKAKLTAKLRLKEWVKTHCNIEIDESFMYDIMVKRIHEYKRQFMNILGCIYRYVQLKEMTPKERENVNKRITFIGGKAAPGYILAKNIIKLANMVAHHINNDNDVNHYFKMVFLPDYNVSSAQIIIPASDINHQISTAGMEASGTSCMKFVMTGSLIIGTQDGANIEIAENIGNDHLFIFGRDVHEVEKIREEIKKGKRDYISHELRKCFDMIYQNKFGDTSFMHEYLNYLVNGGDYYLTCHDFNDFLYTQNKIDKEYQDKDTWDKKCIENICHMGFFSSDRSIDNYAKNIWKLTPVVIPKPKEV